MFDKFIGNFRRTPQMLAHINNALAASSNTAHAEVREAVDQRGRMALALIEDRIAAASPQAHHWRQGDILIIDNWRVLHGRSPSGPGSGRRLARILIDA